MKTLHDILKISSQLKTVVKDQYGLVISEGALAEIVRTELLHRMVDDIKGRIDNFTSAELAILLNALMEESGIEETHTIVELQSSDEHEKEPEPVKKRGRPKKTDMN